jgi:hypothetical protein
MFMFPCVYSHLYYSQDEYKKSVFRHAVSLEFRVFSSPCLSIGKLPLTHSVNVLLRNAYVSPDKVGFTLTHNAQDIIVI